MAMAEIHEGAQVYSSDGHEVGKVIEALTNEFVVQGGTLLHKHMYLLRNDMVQQATPQRVDLNVAKDYIDTKWHTLSLRDKHGQERPVSQVGVAPSIPQYDESQTTTGGPPTGEAEHD